MRRSQAVKFYEVSERRNEEEWASVRAHGRSIAELSRPPSIFIYLFFYLFVYFPA